ncbi:MAG: TIGR02597 family protein, partial [Verrucomicrobiae bacterium]|nr:TIGR02597 family protein [Verrucomicrobiae bacterium]
MAGILLALTLGTATAQFSTPPVGIYKFNCLGGSDTVVSIPFHRAPIWQGTLDGPPVPVENQVSRLNLHGDGPFDGGLPDDGRRYYAYFLPGSQREGTIASIVSSVGPSIEVNMGAGALAGATIGDRLAVIPAWTIADLFPPETQTSIHSSSGNLLTQRKSELLLFDSSGEGINLSAPRKLFLRSDGNWIDSGTFEEAGGIVVLPGAPFIVRHPVGCEDTEFVAKESVFVGRVAIPIRTGRDGGQDNAVALPRPIDLLLGELSFGVGVFQESPTTDPGDRKDTLLVFDNTEARINKKPSGVFFRFSGKWYRDEPGFPEASDFVISGGAGMIVRKAS